MHSPLTGPAPAPSSRTTARRPPARRVRSLVLALSAVAALLFASAAPAAAYEPVGIVHTERVQAGPYSLTVGFSTWPLRAMQSLDFTFAPEGGIAGKSGTLTRDATGLDSDDRVTPLARHPRKLDVWGLDIKSFPDPGDVALTFAIDGPKGHGTGTLKHLTVLDQPGPPLSLSWSVCALPVLGLIAFLVIAWRRNEPARRLAELGI
ncbi:hypothetical protein ACFV9P_21775 [Streptomyces sp. NPDC059892]|uniref:hypothetical protein n=1 Tax=unclassified Streptomyces TaxID=2593676 RepID=UPI00364702DB